MDRVVSLVFTLIVYEDESYIYSCVFNNITHKEKENNITKGPNRKSRENSADSEQQTVNRLGTLL